MSADRAEIARCPACDSRIRFYERPPMAHLFLCPECGMHLEVVGTNPVRLNWADDADEWRDSYGKERYY